MLIPSELFRTPQTVLRKHDRLQIAKINRKQNFREPSLPTTSFPASSLFLPREILEEEIIPWERAALARHWERDDVIVGRRRRLIWTGRLKQGLVKNRNHVKRRPVKRRLAKQRLVKREYANDL